MAKPKQITMAGIKWRLAEVEWEDAYKATKAPIEKLLGNKIGPQLVAWGYTAKVGRYQVILHEYNPISQTADVTVVPLAASVKVNPV